MKFFFNIIVSLLLCTTNGFSGPSDNVTNNQEEANSPLILELIHKNDTQTLLKEIQNGMDISKPINENNMTPLFASIILNNTQMTKIILNHGATPNKIHNSGMTPLLYAIKNKNFEIVKMLISKGVDIHSSTKEGKVTPLIYATRIGNISIISLLIKSGADINEKDENGYKAYDYAKAYHDEKIMDLFIEGRDDKK